MARPCIARSAFDAFCGLGVLDLGAPKETLAGMHWPTLAGGKCNSKSQQVADSYLFIPCTRFRFQSRF